MRILIIFGLLVLSNLLFAQNINTCDFSIMDETVNPGDDFYRYSSGRWLDNNSIPLNKHRFGYFDIAKKRIETQLNDMMKICVEKAKNEKNHIENLVGIFYQTGLDSVRINDMKFRLVEKQMIQIDNISNLKDLSEVFAEFQLSGINPFYEIHDYKYWEVRGTHHLYLRQSQLSLEQRKYYLDENYSDIRDLLNKLVKEYFTEAGVDRKIVESNADLILEIETRLAKNYQTENELSNFRKNYNIFSQRKLKKKFKNIKWDYYFQKLEIVDDKIIIGNPKYFEELNNMLSEISLEEWKVYLKWKLLFKTAKYLPGNLSEKYYELKKQINSYEIKTTDYEISIMEAINKSLPQAIGYLYLKYYFDENISKEINKMMKNLKSAFINRIENNEWLSEKAKNLARKKITTMDCKIGGPNINLENYSKLSLSKSNFIQNLFSSKAFETKIRLKKCGNNILDSEWTVNAQSTNAWYGVNRNDITFPAGNINLLFEINAEKAYNYGTLAPTIAHEMTHSLDNTGRLYDSNGKYIDWWDFENKWRRSDVKKFNYISKKLVEQFENYEQNESLKVNGNLTLGENIADLGGLNIAYDAFFQISKNEKQIFINGYSPKQRFFISYAQKWRDLLSDDLKVLYAKYYMHSPPEFRTNGIIYNIDEFYKAFEIQNGKLFLNKKERIEIW